MIIRVNEVGTIKLTLLNRINMRLLNVAYTSRWDFNFIYFSQLMEAKISYYDYSESLMLKKARNVIGFVWRKKNFFILEMKKNTDKIIIT